VPESSVRDPINIAIGAHRNSNKYVANEFLEKNPKSKTEHSMKNNPGPCIGMIMCMRYISNPIPKNTITREIPPGNVAVDHPLLIPKYLIDTI
jgi:hypothetical protein